MKAIELIGGWQGRGPQELINASLSGGDGEGQRGVTGGGVIVGRSALDGNLVHLLWCDEEVVCVGNIWRKRERERKSLQSCFSGSPISTL